ncbi:MAG: prepilin-type N-terminal cleavage/methylation domain-containing protein [Pseudomonadales bacterium]|nr:prepilin-type N-terminal cleavage/methylation domain-containing protein [Candidatus Woesebacteria bacterium]MCB9801519.1 prepilin-type N-terminal cleavage/methylation domain-containing protein [Pseudomonadales bacterium]
MHIPARLKTAQRGFTLIELLVVIGILAVLLAIVLVAINPARQFAQANNTKRSSDVNAMLNAVNQYMADNRGTPPTGVPASGSADISSAALAGDSQAFCEALVTEYLAALPVDPQTNNGDPVEEVDCSGTWDTGYEMSRSATDNRITVSAPGAELGATITVTR